MFHKCLRRATLLGAKEHATGAARRSRDLARKSSVALVEIFLNMQGIDPEEVVNLRSVPTGMFLLNPRKGTYATAERNPRAAVRAEGS